MIDKADGQDTCVSEELNREMDIDGGITDEFELSRGTDGGSGYDEEELEVDSQSTIG